MIDELGSRIFSAFNEGRKAEAMRLLKRAGDDAIGDPLWIQIMALSCDKQIDQYALLQSAAFDCEGIDPQALFNLAVCDEGDGNVARAILRYGQTLRLQPNHVGALNNYSDLLRRQQRSDEAWTVINSFLDTGTEPDGLEIRIAKIADDCNLPEESEAWFKRAAARNPDDRQIAWEWAMQLLRDKKFAAGWQGYEARRSIFSHAAMGIVQYSAPEWEGKTLRRKSLLVHKEQGLGDTIMFSSCLPDIADKPDILHLAVQPALVRLMAASFPKAKVWPSSSMQGHEQEEHQRWRPLAGHIDYQVPFGTLPLLLRSKQFPKARAYLRAPDRDILLWSRRMEALSPAKAHRLCVGIAITARRDSLTGPGLAEGAPKSLPAALAGDLAQPGIAWFGLHDLPNADILGEVPKLDIIDTSPWLHDLADTAALITNLDLVVTVDTAVAHLAGAMGKKVLLMLRRNADWRWGRGTSESYWYEDIEVFRQETEGHWAPVVTKISQRLLEIASDEGVCLTLDTPISE